MTARYALAMVLAMLLPVGSSALAAGLDAPLDWQVSQQNAQGSAEIRVAGNCPANTGIVEAKTELAAARAGKRKIGRSSPAEHS